MSHTRSSPSRSFAVVALAAVLPLALTSCSGNRAEINAVCDDVHIEAEAVRLAADSVHQEVVVDGIDPQEQHLEYLDDHYEDMRYLEEIARGGMQDAAFERAEAVAYVLDGVDENDDELLIAGVEEMDATEGLILDACD